MSDFMSRVPNIPSAGELFNKVHGDLISPYVKLIV